MSFGQRAPRVIQTSTRRLKEQRIEFRHERSYGRDRYYPENGLARSLTLITGRVCLEAAALDELSKAGFSIVVNSKPWTVSPGTEKE